MQILPPQPNTANRCRDTVAGTWAIIALLRAATTWAKFRRADEMRVELIEEAMKGKMTRILLNSGFKVGGVSFSTIF